MNKFQIGTADRKVVMDLCDRLVKTFEDFAKEKGAESEAGLRYIDGFMGCHNFYKTIIFDLERRCTDESNVIRRTAVETLALALGIGR